MLDEKLERQAFEQKISKILDEINLDDKSYSEKKLYGKTVKELLEKFSRTLDASLLKDIENLDKE